MRDSGSRLRPRAAAAALGLAGGVLVLGAAAWLLGAGRLPVPAWLEGPEAGVRRALRAAGPAGAAPILGAGAALRIERLAFKDALVTAAGDRAEVVAVADADGVVDGPGGPVRVAYLGRERFGMERRAGRGWRPEGDPLPRLSALLETLLLRAGAFERGDAEAYRPIVSEAYRGEEGGKAALLARLAADLAARPAARMRPLAWQVRIERETASVGEDYELSLGAAPPRRLRARLELRDEGGRWRFTAGL